ncbi:MAG: DUF3467 domain-containing protein [Prevotella sp.]|jgi:hypothetical protein
MADNDNQQVKIGLRPEVASGEYSNLAMINHSSSEFVIDFAHMLPITPPQVFSRVIMAPEHTKRLLFALQENVARYEKEFGEIKLPQGPKPAQGNTIAPFGTGKA